LFGGLRVRQSTATWSTYNEDRLPVAGPSRAASRADTRPPAVQDRRGRHPGAL